ncbi:MULTISPECIES: Lrp/AsnC family transcriptional regulator [unclassified Tessaracoccus]|uniref:Lrp/AsnC family transcriptional regulator n=1 Tax=unclassified Tessaracoccus TaxID=2635419 RepID=UPI0015FF9918|nr:MULTISPECIES: Lrp/AsnC family transcriptional regulator [unclassified Tessaracoccus]MBB1511294.1 Lrp/AsnC family transcriptional regulator [Tessaracoccus sp. MC1627]MBB1516781.1 Lrp/AsnC family transcriptional regulator [Tessaracoccus sp. MC1679]
MDAIDRKILAELVEDGRLSLTELADRVQLSLSPCHRRVRKLESDGVIAGYHASLDPKALGLEFEALLFITMRSADHETIDAFERSVHAIPAVVQAQRLFGDPDYLLRILCADLPEYQRLWDEGLSTLPGVQKLVSTLVMKTVVDNRPPPLGRR